MRKSFFKARPYLVQLILLALAVIIPLILKNEYFIHLLVLTYIFALFALSYDLIIGGMGQISLGHQAFFGMGAYIAGLLSVKLHVPVWFCLPAAVFGAGVLGLFLGYVSLRTRGAYLAIVMLGFAMILWMIAMGWRDVTFGQRGVGGIPHLSARIRPFINIVFDTPASFYYIALTFLTVVIYGLKKLNRTRFGRAVAGIRENEDRAVMSGINVFTHLLAMFTVSAMLAGLAGFEYAYYVSFVDPKVLSVYYMGMGLIMVIVGGSGTLPGPIIGAFVFFFIPEWLGIAQELRMVFFGVVLLIFILLMPEGIYRKLLTVYRRLFGNRIKQEEQVENGSELGKVLRN